jgi:hypothetical protein
MARKAHIVSTKNSCEMRRRGRCGTYTEFTLSIECDDGEWYSILEAFDYPAPSLPEMQEFLERSLELVKKTRKKYHV